MRRDKITVANTGAIDSAPRRFRLPLWPGFASWASPRELRESELARAALLRHTLRGLKRTTIVLSLGGAILYPAATGALLDFYHRPTDPFGASELASTHSAVVELCYEFARRRMPCQLDALDPGDHQDFVPMPALSRARSYHLIRDALIGGLIPVVAAVVFWSLWRRFVAAFGRRRVGAAPATSQEIYTLARARE